MYRRRRFAFSMYIILGDRDPPLAKVDPQLVPRRRLKAHGRARLCRQRLPQGRHLTLHRAEAERNPLLMRRQSG
jgi:hypothetical protein